jgi:hypothetical protein
LTTGVRNGFFGKKHTESIRSVISSKAFSRIRTPDELDQARAQLAKVKNNRSNMDIWTEKYGPVIAVEKLAAFKKKQSNNNIGSRNKMYGKPSPAGSGVGWKGWYNGIFFRSLRELGAMLFSMNGLSYCSGEKAEYRVPYIDPMGSPRTYSPDFIIDNRLALECKPVRLWETPSVLAKKEAAISFFESKGMEYRLIDPPIPSKEAMIEMTDNGTIRWLGAYEDKIRNYEVK